MKRSCMYAKIADIDGRQNDHGHARRRCRKERRPGAGTPGRHEHKNLDGVHLCTPIIAKMGDFSNGKKKKHRGTMD